MEFDRLIRVRRGVVLSVVAAIASLEIAGCSRSGSDPNAAPYGASASPSSAQPSAPPTASVSAEPAPDPVGPDTKLPAKEPHSALPGDKGSDVTAPPMSEPSGGPAGTGVPASGTGGPMMGAMGSSPTAPLTPTPEFDAKIAAAEKGGKKTEIGTAYALRGTFRMNDPDAGARVKYRAALEDYRKALAADPKNEEAKHNKDLIEGIYKQMGRPIPGS